MPTTLELTRIARRWRDVLRDSAKIRDYCQEMYGKPATIFLGLNGEKSSYEQHCPVIFILPGTKTEGLIPRLSYELTISWLINQPEVLADGEQKSWDEHISGQLIEFLGVYQTDRLGQLIYEELYNAGEDNLPLAKIKYEIETQANFPLFPGSMTITIKIRPVMGEELTY